MPAFRTLVFNNIMKSCAQNGVRGAFTLIELAVTIVIMGIIALVTIDYLVNAGRTYTLMLAQHQAGSEIADAVERMRREARTARTHLVVASNEWSFINIQGVTNTATNTFLLAGHEVTLNGNCLARGVDRFLLAYYDSTNGSDPTNLADIDHVALSFKVTNSQAESETTATFFLRKGFLK